MDNQGTKAIKLYHTPQECKRQLVEPGNHHVNATERAIQTFKNRFIGALGTTDDDFSIQLWDKMAPQVQDVIKLVCRSGIDPNNSAYESLEGLYDWNWYPLAPLGTKTVIYEDADTSASWAPHGLNAWLLGPFKNHYWCNLNYVPETKGYCNLSSANLFPQHCIALAFTPVTQVQELSTELQDTLATMGRKQGTMATLSTFAQHLDAYVSGTPPPPPVHQEPSAESQRVIDIVDTATSPRIQRVNNEPATWLANNPTPKRLLQAAPHTHQRTTRANTHGALPNITQGANIPVISSVMTPRWLTRVAIRNSRLISQEAINQLLIDNLLPAGHFIPQKLQAKPTSHPDYEHLAMPTTHSVTGKSISSYRRLIKDPATVETLMTAFGKDFGSMCQEDNKEGQKGTNAMFVMLPSNVPNIPKERTTTSARVIVDHHPQKEDPNRI